MNRFEPDLTRYHPDPERNTESEEYLEEIETWLVNQMSRVRSQGHRLEESPAELMEMIDNFRRSPKVLAPLAGVASARGERSEIFYQLSRAEIAMSQDPFLVNRYPSPDKAARARIMGILAQWPILNDKDRRVMPNEYVEWLADRDRDHRAKAA